MTIVRALIPFVLSVAPCLPLQAAPAAPVSEATQACLDCHESATPGIVADWRASAHARTSPAEAVKRPELERRVSSTFEKGPSNEVVGCAECHKLRSEAHADAFDHNGFTISIVVSPADCAVCHAQEAEDYAHNIMAHAYGNLTGNAVYHQLMESINGVQTPGPKGLTATPADPLTTEDSCLYCHGTRVEVRGSAARETALGEMEFPVLTGWPNNGVGRLNPDGTMGSCAACHTRHAFSLAMARKPAACSGCHKGPDVPAYKVYTVSAHGRIYDAAGEKWDYGAVPWVPGRDFAAPTCAACHASLLADGDGGVIARRSHRMNDRLPLRLFGPVYATAHPVSPDTTTIRNAAGLPLPTELTGEPAAEHLIDAAEAKKREGALKSVCAQCHAASWIEGHFKRLDRSVETTNAMTLSATQLLLQAWDGGLAAGPARGGGLFDEAIERMWVEQWLFFANSVRFASAMGGADYGVFADGRWALAKNLRAMADHLKMLEAAAPGKKPKKR